MSRLEVYYANHNKADKFPWSLYHKSIRDDLENFIKNSVKKDSKVLVIGAGEFQEYDVLSSVGAEISVLDIDPRVLENAKSLSGGKIKALYLVDDQFNGYPTDETFDVVYAKEVIEHITAYDKFLKKIESILKPNGKIWLSTPNYGYFLLPLLENTVLELIARVSGFTRKNIHPSKFSEIQLRTALMDAGLSDILTKTTDFKLAITAQGKKS